VTVATTTADGPLTSLIRRVHHVPTYVPEPGKLYEFLSVVLGLPVSWSMGGNDYFRSGAVFVGNCSIEAVRYARSSLAPKPDTPPMFQAVAFETHGFRAAIDELDARELGHFDVPPSTSIHDDEELTWHVSMLREPSSLPAPVFFLCELDHDIDAPRRDGSESLEQAGVGPLGIVGLAEIVVGVPDVEVAAALWHRLLGPSPTTGSASDRVSWELDDGVRFTIEAGPRSIRCLRLAVRSLEAAQAALRERGVRTALAGGGHNIRVSPYDAFGLNIWLTERP